MHATPSSAEATQQCARQPHLGSLVPPARELQQRGAAVRHRLVCRCRHRAQLHGCVHSMPQRGHLATDLHHLLPQLLQAGASTAGVAVGSQPCCQHVRLQLLRTCRIQRQESAVGFWQLYRSRQLLLKGGSCCCQGVRQHARNHPLSQVRCSQGLAAGATAGAKQPLELGC